MTSLGTVRYPELENALLEWILQSQDKIILTDDICLEKAKVFAQMLNILPFLVILNSPMVGYLNLNVDMALYK